MYRIAEIIENDGPSSMVNEVSFHPSGSYFAATYENINEVRIYDSRTRKIVAGIKESRSHSLIVHTEYCSLKNTFWLLISTILKGPAL